MSGYVVPQNPTDPARAALDVIVRLPAELASGDTAMLTEFLQDYTGLLDAEQAFAGLVWLDAKRIAGAVCFDICHRADPAAFLRHRADNAESNADHMDWQDRAGAARAFRLAGELLTMLDG